MNQRYSCPIRERKRENNDEEKRNWKTQER